MKAEVKEDQGWLHTLTNVVCYPKIASEVRLGLLKGSLIWSNIRILSSLISGDASNESALGFCSLECDLRLAQPLRLITSESARLGLRLPHHDAWYMSTWVSLKASLVSATGHV